MLNLYAVIGSGGVLSQPLLSFPVTAKSPSGEILLFQAEGKHLGMLHGFFDFSQPSESMIQGLKDFVLVIRWRCISALTLPSCVTLLKLLTFSVSSSVEWEDGGGYSTCLEDRQ